MPGVEVLIADMPPGVHGLYIREHDLVLAGEGLTPGRRRDVLVKLLAAAATGAAAVVWCTAAAGVD